MLTYRSMKRHSSESSGRQHTILLGDRVAAVAPAPSGCSSTIPLDIDIDLYIRFLRCKVEKLEELVKRDATFVSESAVFTEHPSTHVRYKRGTKAHTQHPYGQNVSIFTVAEKIDRLLDAGDIAAIDCDNTVAAAARTSSRRLVRYFSESGLVGVEDSDDEEPVVSPRKRRRTGPVLDSDEGEDEDKNNKKDHAGTAEVAILDRIPSYWNKEGKRIAARSSAEDSLQLIDDDDDDDNEELIEVPDDHFAFLTKPSRLMEWTSDEHKEAIQTQYHFLLRPIQPMTGNRNVKCTRVDEIVWLINENQIPIVGADVEILSGTSPCREFAVEIDERFVHKMPKIDDPILRSSDRKAKALYGHHIPDYLVERLCWKRVAPSRVAMVGQDNRPLSLRQRLEANASLRRSLIPTQRERCIIKQVTSSMSSCGDDEYHLCDDANSIVAIRPNAVANNGMQMVNAHILWDKIIFQTENWGKRQVDRELSSHAFRLFDYLSHRNGECQTSCMLWYCETCGAESYICRMQGSRECRYNHLRK